MATHFGFLLCFFLLNLFTGVTSCSSSLLVPTVISLSPKALNATLYIYTGDLGLIPGLGRSPGEGKGCPLQYSGLEDSMDCSSWSCKESDTTEWLSLHYISIRGFPGSSMRKNLPANAGDEGLITGSGKPPGEGNGNPLQYSCLENLMDRGVLQATVHGVTKESDTT